MNVQTAAEQDLSRSRLSIIASTLGFRQARIDHRFDGKNCRALARNGGRGGIVQYVWRGAWENSALARDAKIRGQRSSGGFGKG